MRWLKAKLQKPKLQKERREGLKLSYKKKEVGHDYDSQKINRSFLPNCKNDEMA